MKDFHNKIIDETKNIILFGYSWSKTLSLNNAKYNSENHYFGL